MTRALILLTIFAACVDDGPSGGGIDGTTHVETYELPAITPPQLDLLFVIDETIAMASHQTPLAAVPGQLQQRLEGQFAAIANFHIGAITTQDGTLRRSPALAEPFIVHDNTFSGPTNNYQGSLAGALAPLFPSTANSTESSLPLASTRVALENNAANAGFSRSDAFLVVVTITGTDDMSPAPATDYASFLKGTKSDPARVLVSGVFELGAARLSAFHAQFPNRSDTQSIDDSDYGGSLDMIAQLYKTSLGYACNQEPADLDPDVPGPQYDCSFVAIDNGVEKLLPQCVETITQPCWQIVIADANLCVDPAARAHLQTRGYTTSMSAYGDPFHPTIRGQCIVN
jgi:hypothetical protein